MLSSHRVAKRITDFTDTFLTKGWCSQGMSQQNVEIENGFWPGFWVSKAETC